MGKNWKLRDVIMVGGIGVVFSFIYLGVLYFGQVLQVALAPLGLSPFAYEIIYGIWFSAATLAAYIMQKPGVAFASEIIASFLELFMGNIGGPLVIIAGTLQGIGTELGFAAFKYKKFDRVSLSLSGTFAAIITFLWGFVQSGYANLAPGLLISMLVVRILSAVIFSGVLVKIVGDLMAKTGILKSYPLGKDNIKLMKVEEL
ncbi:MAG: ABC transporter permease [Tissierellia bacterium]|nr:ABC transporter permease [Tissierellia bacterium]